MHTPVLLKEVLQYLNPQPNKNFIDGTVGEGGHSLAILNAIAPNGKLLGIDFNQRNLDVAKEKFLQNNIPQERFILVQGNFKNIKQYIAQNNFYNIAGVLLDLGLCSYFIDESEMGFSFKKNERLDMRFDTNSPLTAYDIVNTFKEQDIADIIYKYGEERFSRKIAKSIVEARKVKNIETSQELADIIKHNKSSARVFQALRIYVNKELDNLQTAIPDILDILDKNGRLVIISFHSLEDRIVKNLFKQYSLSSRFRLLTKKPIIPSKEEIHTNVRSHSAKMRAIEKI
jgi:16S rRNA (cytosine1402-N4)-methyltransferase